MSPLRTLRLVALAASALTLLCLPAEARPSLGGGGHGGGNIGGHFSGGGAHMGGGGAHMRPGGGGSGTRHPVPHPQPHPGPGPHPHPGPGPHPHPGPGPGPHPHPPVPYPWIPGALVWGAAIADDMWDDYASYVIYALPGNCQVVHVDGAKYAHCGSDWYQQVLHGSQVAYIEVPDPR